MSRLLFAFTLLLSLISFSVLILAAAPFAILEKLNDYKDRGLRYPVTTL